MHHKHIAALLILSPERPAGSLLASFLSPYKSFPEPQAQAKSMGVTAVFPGGNLHRDRLGITGGVASPKFICSSPQNVNLLETGLMQM